MNKIKELEKKEQLIRKEKEALLEKRSREIHIPRLKKYIGRYFMYPENGYSRSEKKEDYWDEFYRIVDFVNDTFIVENCYVDSQGVATIKIEAKYEYTDGRKPFSSWVEITKEQYEKELAKVWLELYTQNKMREYLKKEL
jgi:hypothetical protein